MLLHSSSCLVRLVFYHRITNRPSPSSSLKRSWKSEINERCETRIQAAARLFLSNERDIYEVGNRAASEWLVFRWSVVRCRWSSRCICQTARRQDAERVSLKYTLQLSAFISVFVKLRGECLVTVCEIPSWSFYRSVTTSSGNSYAWVLKYHSYKVYLSRSNIIPKYTVPFSRHPSVAVGSHTILGYSAFCWPTRLRSNAGLLYSMHNASRSRSSQSVSFTLYTVQILTLLNY